MYNIEEELEKRGYRRHVHESYRIFKSTNLLYQKRITDANGTRYFINAWIYPELPVEQRVQFETQFSNEGEAVLDACSFYRNPEEAENQFKDIWSTMGYGYTE